MGEDDYPGDDVALQYMWLRMVRIEHKQDLTNGRVSRLEKFQYMVSGGLIVLAIVVAPLVIRILTES